MGEKECSVVPMNRIVLTIQLLSKALDLTIDKKGEKCEKCEKETNHTSPHTYLPLLLYFAVGSSNFYYISNSPHGKKKETAKSTSLITSLRSWVTTCYGKASSPQPSW